MRRSDGRRSALHQVLNAVEEWEPSIKSLDLFAMELDDARTRQITEWGEKKDSILFEICLYSHWLYDGEGTHLFGDASDGHILLV